MVGLNLTTKNIYMRNIVSKTLNLLAYEKNFYYQLLLPAVCVQLRHKKSLFRFKLIRL